MLPFSISKRIDHRIILRNVNNHLIYVSVKNARKHVRVVVVRDVICCCRILSTFCRFVEEWLKQLHAKFWSNWTYRDKVINNYVRSFAELVVLLIWYTNCTFIFIKTIVCSVFDYNLEERIYEKNAFCKYIYIWNIFGNNFNSVFQTFHVNVVMYFVDVFNVLGHF